MLGIRDYIRPGGSFDLGASLFAVGQLVAAVIPATAQQLLGLWGWKRTPPPCDAAMRLELGPSRASRHASTKQKHGPASPALRQVIFSDENRDLPECPVAVGCSAYTLLRYFPLFKQDLGFKTSKMQCVGQDV